MALMGHLRTIQITTILQILSDENKTGVLRATNKEQQVKFFLKEGSILCVMGTLEKARLGNLLRNSDILSQSDLSKCLKLSKEKNQTLGKILLDEGLITAEKLGAVVNKQAEMVIANLLSWKDGAFEYRDGTINMKNMIVTPINIMGLILESLKQKDEKENQEDEIILEEILESDVVEPPLIYDELNAIFPENSPGIDDAPENKGKKIWTEYEKEAFWES